MAITRSHFSIWSFRKPSFRNSNLEQGCCFANWRRKVWVQLLANSSRKRRVHTCARMYYTQYVPYMYMVPRSVRLPQQPPASGPEPT